MKICSKPNNWNSLGFNEKLIHFNESPNKLRSILSDKFMVKDTIKLFNESFLPDLYYANVITHLFSFFDKPDSQFIYIVPIDHDFLPTEELIQNKVSLWEKNGRSQSFIDTEFKIRDIIRINRKEKAKYEKLYSKRCIIKYSCAWNSYIFVNKNRVSMIYKGNDTLPPHQNSFHNWRNMCVESFSENPKRIDINAVIFAEEFINFNMPVYQFYCIHGKPLVFVFYYEGGQNRHLNSYQINYKTRTRIKKKNTFTYIDDQVYASKTIKYNKPLEWNAVERMLEMSTHMAKAIEFVRIDFYYTNNKIYFSEYSFTPFSMKKLRFKEIKWGKTGQILAKAWKS
jgi:hypothetical protein